jgi:hypothetical protein
MSLSGILKPGIRSAIQPTNPKAIEMDLIIICPTKTI